MAVCTQNFDRALKINIGIGKLLNSELVRLRYRKHKVLRQLKRAQSELKTEISKRKNDSFHLKIEEKQFHKDIDAVCKSLVE